MPLYEYECEACGHHLEEQQKLADAPLTKCPKCGKKKLQRVISATAFHLKGGGWYKDLYSSQKPGSGASDESGGGAPVTESKPADAKADKADGKEAKAEPAVEKKESKPDASKSDAKPAKKAGKATNSK